MQQFTPNQQNLQAMLSNLNIAGLKNKIIFTLAMILIFRFCAQLPLFGINSETFANLAATNNLIGFLDMFSGGALGNVSIIALGIGPYITASIIMQLLAVVIPQLEQLQKEEGEAGRRKLSQYTRVFTIIIAAIQAIVFVIYLIKTAKSAIMPDVNIISFAIGSVIIMTAGSAFTMWLAELMTERGIGNGASMLIFCGIISKIPFYTSQTATLVSGDSSLQPGLVLLLLIFFATMVFIGLNAHQWLFAAIYKSFQSFPLSPEYMFTGSVISQVLHMSSSIFSIGISMILPIFCVMFISEVLMGFMSKMMPQMNIFMVAIPLKIYVGIVLILMFLSPTVTYLAAVTQNYLKGILNIFM